VTETGDAPASAVHSTLRELIAEHVFLGELLRYCWNREVFDLEVSRSEIDSFGYDIVVGRGPLVRHIQL